MLSQELYVKFDLIMISMLNQTSLHPPPWQNDGYHVPQATAMSIKQATAIKAVAPDKPVFAYITGYLAQNTFEGGAKFRQPEYSAYWLRDSRGALIDDRDTSHELPLRRLYTERPWPAVGLQAGARAAVFHG